MTDLDAPIGPIGHHVDGKPFDGTGSRTAPVYDPATGRIRAEVRLASAADVDATVASSVAAAAAWRRSSLTARAKVMFAARPPRLAACFLSAWLTRMRRIIRAARPKK